MALPKNRQAVQEILKELEPRVLGKERSELNQKAIAVAIIPAGDSYPGQEALWYIWTVKMEPLGESTSWSTDLSSFLSVTELDTLFNRYFDVQDTMDRTYRLDVDGVSRVDANLPPAVRIQENDDQMRFSFSWGREQLTAEQLYEIYQNSPRRLTTHDEAHDHVISILSSIQPKVYRGGPDPELPHESTWHLDYETALAQATTVEDHLFFQSLCTQSRDPVRAYIDTDIVFMKHEVK